MENEEHVEQQSYSAFAGERLMSQGNLEEVVVAVKRKLKADTSLTILIFSDSTGKEMDFDLRGSESEVLQRLRVFLPAEKGPATADGPGRPKLGVVAREVSLLPRHWEWLSTQSGGASATLRRLVDEARKQSVGKDRIRQAQARVHKFLSAIAGNLPGYEEALRALYAKDRRTFTAQMAGWPADIRKHAAQLGKGAFEHD